jgi:aminomethyltransferase
MVVNAGNKYKDLEHMNNIKSEFFKGKDVSIQYIEDRSLIALQGPAAKDVLQKILKDQLDLSKVFKNE